MVRIGIVGVGFMGMIHYLAARKLQGARVEALCSRIAVLPTGTAVTHEMIESICALLRMAVEHGPEITRRSALIAS